MRLLLLAGVTSTVASTGHMVRVEKEPNREVSIAGGSFVMGMTEQQAADLELDCLSAHDRPILAGQAVGMCDLYKQESDHMHEHTVYLDPYFIDRDEVSVTDYRRCVASGTCTLDALIAGDERYIRDDWPLVNVTWFEARVYCNWRGGRLPTEAEWERAARGPNHRVWPWGDVARLRDFNHGKTREGLYQELDKKSHVIGIPFDLVGDPDDVDGAEILAPNNSYVWGEGEGGIRNLAGNVAEWTADAYYNSFGRPSSSTQNIGYQTSGGFSDDGEQDWVFIPSINPVREGDIHDPRVVRGGSWRQPPWLGRSYARDPFNLLYEPGRRYTHIGFRCARDR